jgi:hypothetical protein
VGEWRKAEAARDPVAVQIFAELGPGEHDLLESERFRALLEEQPLARAA